MVSISDPVAGGLPSSAGTRIYRWFPAHGGSTSEFPPRWWCARDNVFDRDHPWNVESGSFLRLAIPHGALSGDVGQRLQLPVGHTITQVSSSWYADSRAMLFSLSVSHSVRELFHTLVSDWLCGRWFCPAIGWLRERSEHA